MKHSLQEKLADKHLILASGSPRRQELMKGLDVPFTVQTKAVEEYFPDHLQAQEITAFIAQLKADAFTDLAPDDLIITADTIVWFGNQAVLKPTDRAEAYDILEHLSGKKHEVFTSVCLKSADKQVVFSDQTSVYFSTFDANDINYYIDVYQPFDKAGAYGVQEWLGYIGIDRIEGSYYNVMGLPVHRLYGALNDF